MKYQYIYIYFLDKVGLRMFSKVISYQKALNLLNKGGTVFKFLRHLQNMLMMTPTIFCAICQIV